ncbi:MAG TPA: guanitoxin biosynthesis heme-dependent pre-guanitoxin N-hydroxylase GntA [Thiobacillus sp.]
MAIGRWRHDRQTVMQRSPPHAANQSDEHLIAQFEQFVSSEAFPCVGAKSALNRHQMVFHVEADFSQPPNVSTVDVIQQFSQAYNHDSPLFQSLIVLFRQPVVLDETGFETLLWRYLQRLHELDALDYEWDAHVNKDPASENFSFSIGGRAYYVVGLHPGASRAARRFSTSALVFNLHDQFERLRHNQKYESIRNTIIKRDIELEGTPNPMLKTFGTHSEAPQYSGRAVEANWKCPFHAR